MIDKLNLEEIQMNNIITLLKELEEDIIKALEKKGYSITPEKLEKTGIIEIEEMLGIKAGNPKKYFQYKFVDKNTIKKRENRITKELKKYRL